MNISIYIYRPLDVLENPWIFFFKACRNPGVKCLNFEDPLKVFYKLFYKLLNVSLCDCVFSEYINESSRFFTIPCVASYLIISGDIGD